MTRLLLVRHADAGDRTGWQGDDANRPLTARGVRQAEELAWLLPPILGGQDRGPDRGPAEVRASPAQRCVATVAPLAAALGTSVIVDETLFEGASIRTLIDRMTDVATVGIPSVWASHGDVIPGVLMELARSGLDLGHEPRCRKGSTWILDLAPTGRVVRADYLERPDGAAGRAPGRTTA
jgi:8-oxo-(d)GTP phosphatase